MLRFIPKIGLCEKPVRSRRNALFAALLALGLLMIPAFAFASYPGDVNGDSQLNIVDLQCVILGSLDFTPADPTTTPGCLVAPDAGDLNCASGMNIVDVQMIARMTLAHLHGLPGIPIGKDYDRDNVHNDCDLCPQLSNPAQNDYDDDGLGDACDPSPAGGTIANPCEGVVCDPGDGWGCVLNSCNIQTGLCEQWPEDAGCDDEIACSADSCDYESGLCNHAPADIPGCEETDPDALKYGDLLITEFLANPSGYDKFQEFVELYNNTDAPIDLYGFMLHDDEGDIWSIDETLVVDAGAFVTLGSHDTDGVRWGHPVDYSYPHSSFTLTNTGDEIVIYDGNTMLDKVVYGADWSVEDGKSIGLHPDHFDAQVNDDVGAWCVSTVVAGGLDADGDAGSPGSANESCDLGDWTPDGGETGGDEGAGCALNSVLDGSPCAAPACMGETYDEAACNTLIGLYCLSDPGDVACDNLCGTAEYPQECFVADGTWMCAPDAAGCTNP